MFQKIRKRFLGKIEPPEVYLGDLAVIPRHELKSFLEFDWNAHRTDEQLRDWMAEVVELPFIDENTDFPDDAVRMDLLLSNYSLGSDIAFFSNPVVPLLWRPKVELHCRLVRVSSGKVIGVYQTKKSVPWRDFFSRVFTLRSFFSFRATYSTEDLQFLLGQALVDALAWAKGRL